MSKALKKQSTVILFGSENDPLLKDSIKKAKATGRKVEIQKRPSFDTGLGQCGNHLCNCKSTCAVASDGDQGTTMGSSY